MTPTLPSLEGEIISKRRSRAEPNPLFRIALTGGPCGGKTTALARLSSYLKERGFEVGVAPEAFTLLMTNGISFDFYDTPNVNMGRVIQNSVMSLQMALEDSLANVLKNRGKPAVLICDRGLMDGSAYMTKEDWETLIEEREDIRSIVEVRDQRYNAVFHLVTAAQGAERYYTLENNVVRTETVAEARDQDEKTRMAWLGHPKLCVFDNSTDFEGKLERVVAAAAKLVGLPSKLHSRVSSRNNKFLLKGRPNLSIFPPSVKYQVFDIEKVYLYDDVNLEDDPEFCEEFCFVRKRSYSNNRGTAYGQTTVRRTRESSDQEIEVKRIISLREYNSAIKSRDMSRHIIRQTRISFLWQTQSFVVHMYNAPIDNVCLLYCQTESDHADIEFPPFLDVERPVSNKGEDYLKYGAYSISKKTD